MGELEAAVDDLIAALTIHGRSPEHHRRVMARHRREWPTLWWAIDRVAEARRSTQ